MTSYDVGTFDAEQFLANRENLVADAVSPPADQVEYEAVGKALNAALVNPAVKLTEDRWVAAGNFFLASTKAGYWNVNDLNPLVSEWLHIGQLEYTPRMVAFLYAYQPIFKALGVEFKSKGWR